VREEHEGRTRRGETAEFAENAEDAGRCKNLITWRMELGVERGIQLFRDDTAKNDG
jgi:hypothetical protein